MNGTINKLQVIYLYLLQLGIINFKLKSYDFKVYNSIINISKLLFLNNNFSPPDKIKLKMAFDAGPIVAIILSACAFIVVFWIVYACLRRRRLSRMAPPPQEMPGAGVRIGYVQNVAPPRPPDNPRNADNFYPNYGYPAYQN